MLETELVRQKLRDSVAAEYGRQCTLGLAVVRQIKLRIQASLTFWYLLIAVHSKFDSIYSYYLVDIKTRPRLSPFRPDLSESKWRRCAACA